MPHDIFVSHVEEDAGVAIEIAQELERAGFTTWYYERDSLPGPEYLLQVTVAIDQARIVIVVISPHSLSSNQVTSEVVRAYEAGKSFVPLLLGITHAEFQQRQPVWRQALGASTSLSLPTLGLAGVFPRIIAGVRALLAAPVGASSTAVPIPPIQAQPEIAPGIKRAPVDCDQDREAQADEVVKLLAQGKQFKSSDYPVSRHHIEGSGWLENYPPEFDCWVLEVQSVVGKLFKANSPERSFVKEALDTYKSFKVFKKSCDLDRIQYLLIKALESASNAYPS